jgi:hypothetical protein
MGVEGNDCDQLYHSFNVGLRKTTKPHNNQSQTPIRTSKFEKTKQT